MISSTATAVTRSHDRSRTLAPKIATVLIVAQVLIAVSLVLALAVIGAADAAGWHTLVPAPGPMPVPSVAPPGLDL